MAKTQRTRKTGRSGALKTAGIAFIGGGNMAEALIRGLLEAGIAKAGSICVSGRGGRAADAPPGSIPRPDNIR